MSGWSYFFYNSDTTNCAITSCSLFDSNGDIEITTGSTYPLELSASIIG